MSRKRLVGWIYKCRLRSELLTGLPEDGWSWVESGWLDEEGEVADNFGGEEWIQSPQSWGYLAQANKGDLVFCHQTDLRGLVGVTIAASCGYPDPDGVRTGTCTTIDLGPDRVAFDNTVTVPMIREIMGSLPMVAYADGTSQHTFHPIEQQMLLPIIGLCCEANPGQRRAIENLARLRYGHRLGLQTR
jgi:hypothetical protein